ncbi:MAG: hypothetical protein AAGI48_03760 [Verrucomicrobiota bacterium]
MAVLVQPVKVNGVWLCLTQLPPAGTDHDRKTISEKSQGGNPGWAAPTGDGIVTDKWGFSGSSYVGQVHAGVNCAQTLKIHIDGDYEDDLSDSNGISVFHNGVRVGGSGYNTSEGYWGLASGPGVVDVSEVITRDISAERPCGHEIRVTASWGSGANNFSVWITLEP